MEGFFHADSHPGNLKWWKGRGYFLDFGMAGEVGPDIREHLMLLLMAFWQGDAVSLTEITVLLGLPSIEAALMWPSFRSRSAS